MDTDILNMVPLKTFLIFFISFTLTLFILPQLRRIATKIGLLDYPNQRKIHKYPKPLIGGLAMIIALSISCFMFLPLASFKGFYVGMIMLVITGLLDDYKK